MLYCTVWSIDSMNFVFYAVFESPVVMHALCDNSCSCPDNARSKNKNQGKLILTETLVITLGHAAVFHSLSCSTTVEVGAHLAGQRIRLLILISSRCHTAHKRLLRIFMVFIHYLTIWKTSHLIISFSLVASLSKMCVRTPGLSVPLIMDTELIL